MCRSVYRGVKNIEKACWRGGCEAPYPEQPGMDHNCISQTGNQGDASSTPLTVEKKKKAEQRMRCPTSVDYLAEGKKGGWGNPLVSLFILHLPLICFYSVQWIVMPGIVRQIWRGCPVQYRTGRSGPLHQRLNLQRFFWKPNRHGHCIH